MMDERLSDESMRITLELLAGVRQGLARGVNPEEGEPDDHRAVRTVEAEAIRARASEAALVAEVRRLRDALVLAEEAMNHMGDTLNEMDVVEASDEDIVTPAFKAVRIALGHPLPGDEA